jgi:hypothetical protein
MDLPGILTPLTILAVPSGPGREMAIAHNRYDRTYTAVARLRVPGLGLATSTLATSQREAYLSFVMDERRAATSIKAAGGGPAGAAVVLLRRLHALSNRTRRRRIRLPPGHRPGRPQLGLPGRQPPPGRPRLREPATRPTLERRWPRAPAPRPRSPRQRPGPAAAQADPGSSLQRPPAPSVVRNHETPP